MINNSRYEHAASGGFIAGAAVSSAPDAGPPGDAGAGDSRASCAALGEKHERKNTVMMQTERIRIYPASRAQMESLLSSEQDDELRKAYGEMLRGSLAHPDDRDWYAVWMIEPGDRLWDPGGVPLPRICRRGRPARASVGVPAPGGEGRGSGDRSGQYCLTARSGKMRLSPHGDHRRGRPAIYQV